MSNSTSETSTKETQAQHQGAFPLSTNNLSNLVTYTQRPFGTALLSQVSLPAGSPFTAITTATPAPKPLYSTVQTGRATHIELNSALLYMNHSCAPSLEVDVSTMKVRVARDRDLKIGDDLTFFYPSTEWEFDRPFECLCGAGKGVCVGRLGGAKDIDAETLKRWFVNEHILEMVREREAKRTV